MAAVAPETPPEAVLLSDPPTDGVTQLVYLKSKPNSLVSTSWDGAIRIHDTSDKTCTTKHVIGVPLLSLATGTITGADGSMSDVIYTGGLDGAVRAYDVASATTTTVGTHNKSKAQSPNNEFCCAMLSVCTNQQVLASASWNKTLCFWDLDTSPTAPLLITTIELPGKVFAMDYDPVHNRLVVATSGRRMVFVDMSKSPPAIVTDRESTLKYQTRCVAFRKDGIGMAVGSIEGRVGMEFMEEAGSMKDYAFKCHRVQTTVYPVNCIAFHPRVHGTFATGGCDGNVVLWDGNNKKKLSTFQSFPTSIAAMAMNGDGSEIAIASSYTFEEGDRAHPKDEIYVRKLLDSECQPKRKSK